jgi:hypothetical protein
MFASWILAAGVVQLLSRLFYGKGSFENTAGVMGFGITIASLATSIHDLVSSFLGAIKVIDQHEFEVALNSPTIWRAILWVLMLAYLVWFIVLFTKGIKIAQKVKTGEALLLGTMGFIVYQVLFFVFNR